MSNIVITNINERIREVLAKYDICLAMCGMDRDHPVTGILRDNIMIGSLDFVTSVESGMKNAKIFIDGLGTFSIEDGPDMEVDLGNMEDKLKTAFKPESDPDGMKITVQYLNDSVKRLSIEKKGDWIDMYAAETVELKQGEHKLIHLGVAMKLPEGYEAHLVPRSSTFKKWGIIQANHVGIIDNSYSGPEDWWRMSVIAMRDTVINKDDKICQFRIVERQPRIHFVEGKMTDPSRGGFGSTGSK
jgi:dUTP pyrophosphatase